MPNLWTKTIQSFSGPRTNDLEIKKKYEEAVMMDKALKNLKNVILNFTHRFEEIMNYNRHISESIIILYDNNEEYKEFGQVLNQVHLENNKLFKQISMEISDLNEKTKDWPTYFAKVKDLYEEKEEIRKIYDHYEEKLEELILEKEEKTKKGFHLNETFIRKLERNKNKFLGAKEKYLKKCIDAYDTLEILLNDRFNLINQPLLNLFNIEMQLYENFSSKYKKYRDLEIKLSNMRKNFAQKDREMRYDPTIYMKNPYLESKFSITKEQLIEDSKKLQEEHLNENFNNLNQIQENVMNISTESNRKKTKISEFKVNKINSDDFNDMNHNIASLANNIHQINNISTNDEYHIQQKNINNITNLELEEFKLDSKQPNQIYDIQNQNFDNNILHISLNNVSSSNSNSENSEDLVSPTDNLNIIFEDNSKKVNNVILFEKMNNYNTDQLNTLNQNNDLVNLQGDPLENYNNKNNKDMSKMSYPSLKSLLDQYNIEARNSYTNRNNFEHNVFAMAKREDLNNCVLFDYFDDRPKEKQIKNDTQIRNHSRLSLDDLFDEDKLIYNREIVNKVSTSSVDPFADFY